MPLKPKYTIAFLLRDPSNTPLAMGRQPNWDIDVLLVDKSNNATQIYHSTERRYKLSHITQDM